MKWKLQLYVHLFHLWLSFFCLRNSLSDKYLLCFLAVEKIQRNQEVSVGCFHSKALSNLQQCESALNGFSDSKDYNDSQDVAISNSLDIIEALAAALLECHQRPIFWKGICNRMWLLFHPQIQQVPRNKFNFIDYFSPMKQECPFFIKNSTRHMHLEVLSQVYPHEFQLQEFQYFVVIDFEAACDKEKNSSPTRDHRVPINFSELHDWADRRFFSNLCATYIYQILTDFCKELTGIQQIQVHL